MYMLTIRINYRIRKWTGNLPKENIEIKAVTSE